MSKAPVRALLIGWAGDLALCQPLLAAGQMPHLKRLIEQGASGELTAVTPLLSAPAWTSVATGKRPFKHGVHGLFEVDLDIGGARPASRVGRVTKAVWNILSEAGFDASVIGWPATHPAERLSGVSVTDLHMVARVELGKPWPQPEGSVYPEAVRSSLAGLRMHPGELERDILEFFIPKFETIKLTEGGRVRTLTRWLAASITTHAIATWAMQNRPWEFMSVCYAGMERLLDGYLRFMPPHTVAASDRDIELLQGVVPAMYKLHDRMLGRLVELAGDRAVVMLVSPYGWKSASSRQGPPGGDPEQVESLRRPRGMVVVRGSRVSTGSTFQQASVLDVTPTVLGLFGLPIGRDMDGRDLLGAAERSSTTPIQSWDDAEREVSPSEPAVDENRHRLEAIIEELAEMGHRDPQQDDLAAEQERVQQRNKFNYARSLMEGGECDRAAEALHEIVAKQNNDIDAITLLLELHLMSGAHDAAAELVGRLKDASSPPALIALFLGRIALGRGELGVAREQLQRAASCGPRDPRAWLFLGRVHLAAGDPREARAAFERALAMDIDSPDARRELLAMSASAS